MGLRGYERTSDERDSEVMKGLSECEASESNVRRIPVKDIVKEVEDYLKTYSSAGMDISCLVVLARTCENVVPKGFYDWALGMTKWVGHAVPKHSLVTTCRSQSFESVVRNVDDSSSERLRKQIGAELSEKKITWVAWDKVLASKKKGGLGVSSYYALNRALLLKWVWRFVSQDDSLWFRVIQAIHGSRIDSQSIHSSSLWSSILKEVHVLKDRGFDFLEKCSKRVGNGSNTCFWLDSWKGGTSFREAFPRLFALEMNRQISVKDKLAAALDSSFRRPVRGGVEKDQLTGLAAILDTVSLSPSLDRWVCSLSSDGDFCVKDARTNIDDMFLPSHNDSTRWVKGVPIKINIFAWRARRDCLPTRLNLIQKGVTLETTSCPICLAGEEDVSHVFFRCPLAQAVLRRNMPMVGGVGQQWYLVFGMARMVLSNIRLSPS
ncbi:RNA-directed DNA polymerase, eukaryota [Tanacetum coccineum]